jgi:DNA-binding HxlR family transcriptional regulator
MDNKTKEEMMEAKYPEDILFMLKALADESRLALLRILAQGECNVGDLAERMELTEPTISHHLTRLRESGLVTLRMAGTARYYRVNQSGLARFKILAAEIEKAPVRPSREPDDKSWIAALGWDEYDSQVLRDYTREKRLTSLPNKQKKTLVILRWIATLFEHDRLYSEAEVNEVLKSVYAADYVSLRRDLIDVGHLRREKNGDKYWKV